MPELLFLDDLRVGQRFTSAKHVVDADQIKRFAGEFDPQPFHLDEAVAAKSLFGGLAASGWHTAAISDCWKASFNKSPTCQVTPGRQAVSCSWRATAWTS